jgi:hypothetical protein
MVAYARSCCTYCAKCGSAHYLCNLRYWIPSLCLDNSLVLLWLSLCGFACHLLRMRLQWSMSNCEARVRSWIDFSLDHRSLNEAWCERGAAGARKYWVSWAQNCKKCDRVQYCLTNEWLMAVVDRHPHQCPDLVQNLTDCALTFILSSHRTVSSFKTLSRPTAFIYVIMYCSSYYWSRVPFRFNFLPSIRVCSGM